MAPARLRVKVFESTDVSEHIIELRAISVLIRSMERVRGV
jgi:hypothetical protein